MPYIEVMDEDDKNSKAAGGVIYQTPLQMRQTADTEILSNYNKSCNDSCKSCSCITDNNTQDGDVCVEAFLKHLTELYLLFSHCSRFVTAESYVVFLNLT